jgi:hypothetical protein
MGKTDGKNDDKAAPGSRLKPSDVPPLRRITIADVRKVEALVRARRDAGN